MTSILLSVDDLRRATGWGHYRIRSMLKVPYPLAFQQAPTGPLGGTKARLYRLDDVLVRCRLKPSFTTEKEAELLRAAQHKLYETENND